MAGNARQIVSMRIHTGPVRPGHGTNQEIRSMTFSSRIGFAMRMALMALTVIMLTAPTLAQQRNQGQTQDRDYTPIERLEQVVHYTLIARPGLAASHARELLDAPLTDAELAELVDDGTIATERLNDAFSYARNIPEVTDLMAEIEHRIEQGRLDLARDPERIREAIAMLNGTARAQFIARRRLEAAGEYAVPYLLNEIIEGTDDRIRMRAEATLRDIGRVAVTPLSIALPALGETHQQVVCNILADIGHPHAAPYLLELSMNANASDVTRQVATRAYRRVGGGADDLSTQFANLANSYFTRAMSLVAYPGDDYNNVWHWDDFVGLVPTPVPTEIFTQVMAMRTATRSLQFDHSNRTALSLYVAANLKRQNDLPADEQDPIYGDADYSPEFYATVFGPSICYDILSMALDMRDTRLVRNAIDALSHTTGGASLISDGSRQPLLEAIYYPDRRTQYDAALVLGNALPEEKYEGDFAVVPILASAVRSGGRSFAVVIASDQEERSVLSDRLTDLDFEMIGAAGSLSSLELQIAESVGVDLVVLSMSNADAAEDLLDQLRLQPRTIATPVLVLAGDDDMRSLQREYDNDYSVHTAGRAISDDAFNAAVDYLLDRAVGGRMSEFEGEVYAIRAIDALRNIAVNRSDVYDIADAESTLVEAIDMWFGDMRDRIASTLSMIDSERAQRKLLDLAFSLEDNERIAMLDHAAASVRRFGNLAEDRHAKMVVDLIVSSSGETADAAARLHGAMNLPPDSALQLIVD